MAERARLVVAILCLLVLGNVSPAAEPEVHRIHLGVSPFGVIWGMYRAEVGVPLSDIAEAAVQVNHFRGNQFAKMIGSAEPLHWPDTMSLGATLRVFPSKQPAGLFVAARLMYLHVEKREPEVVFTREASSWTGRSTSLIHDATAGIDVGWRWKWPLTGRGGLVFQPSFGVQRWLLGGDLEQVFGKINLPVWPSSGLHFGIYF